MTHRAELGMITIPKDEYDQLKESERLLEALQGAGVDNWEGYDYALELMENE